MWEKKKKNVMSTTFSQQILSGRLLLVVISGQRNILSCGFKLEPITIYHMQCCENIVNVTLLKKGQRSRDGESRSRRRGRYVLKRERLAW